MGDGVLRNDIASRLCYGAVLPILAGLLMGASFSANAADVTCTTSLNNCGATIGSPDSQVIVVNTTEAINIQNPVLGFGLLTNYFGWKLNDITITTTASQADAVRINTIGSYVFAKRLTVTTTGSDADGINVASNPQSPGNDAIVYVSDYANITATAGTAVRVNNFYAPDSNSVAILPSGSTIKVIGTGAAQQGSSTLNAASYGYGVYAGNRNYDMNAIGTLGAIQGQNNNTFGNSYAFIGSDSVISTSTRNGHAVYANKGGLVQLSDGANVSTTGTGAYALYAATEQQGSYTANKRPGYIFLEGGATLRAANTPVVMQANGVGSIIANKAMDAGAVVNAIVPDGDWTYWWKTQQFQRLDPSNTGLLDKAVSNTTSGVFDVIGIMDATGGGEIDLNMTGGSSFVGSTNLHPENATASSINLNIDGPASIWSINADSSLIALNLTTGATLDASAGNFVLSGNAASTDGIIGLSGAAQTAEQTLTIDGNYAAAGNARLLVDTVLGDSSSPSDVLTIDGGTVSGSTQVTVHNVGGLGAQTTGDGILVVQAINGGTTAPGAFTLAGGTVRAGDYVYVLERGDASGNGDNWYLRSTFSPETSQGGCPVPEPAPPETGGDQTDGDHKTPNPCNASVLPTLPPALLALLALVMVALGCKRKSP